MSKDEAMENFQNALNNSTNEQEIEKQKQEIIENDSENRKKKIKPTYDKPEEPEEQEEKQPTEEERLMEEQEDRTRYNIYDDDDDDEDEEDDDTNTTRPIKRRKSNGNNQGKSDVADEDEVKDNADNSNESQFKIGDNKDSYTSAGASKAKDNKNKNTESDGANEKYRPNNPSNTSGDMANKASEASEAASEAAEKADAARKAAAATEKGAETAAKGGKIVAFLTKLFGKLALWKVILIIVIVIIALIFIIGFLSFFISGVGLVREKLLNYADTLWKGFYGFLVGDDRAQVDKQNIIDIADYLEEMGYDLVNYGFLNTNGKQVTVEQEKDEEGNVIKETVKNAKGQIILEKEMNEETKELEITDMKSKYILAYLTAENRTYIVANQNKSVVSVLKNLGDWFIENGEYSEDRWGTGMLYIEGMSEETANNLGVNGESDWGKSKNIKIDRENKKMIITKGKNVYQYDLDGWSGRYGMPIEFLLTLHVATMAPDFVYDVATDNDFDSKVHVALYEVGTSVKFVYKTEEGYVPVTEENYGEFGITTEEWNAMNEYNNDDIITYTPIITKVTNHWCKNLDFAGCYTDVENDPNTAEDDDKFVYYYKYIGLGEENDILSSMSDRIENIYIREERKNDVFQTQEPKVVDNSKKIKQMLLGSTDEENSENTNEKYKYDIYTGTELPKEQEAVAHDYIIKKIETQDKNDNDEDGENSGSTYVMNTNTFTYAFAILESVHSEDAEFILRDLKELFRSIGIKDETLEEDKGNAEVQPLEWPIEGYKPVVWDPTSDADNSKVNIRHKTEDTLGFDEGINFIMPADGEIIQVNKGETTEDDTYTGDSLKIKFTGTDGRDDIKDMYIYISGIKLDDSITAGQTYSSKERIGETIDRDIIIVMTDSKRKAVQNVEDYLQPEIWELEKTDKITDSNFQNDIFGENRTQIGGDYNVNTASGQNILTKEQILKGLEWYASANPQGYNNIVNNIDAFMEVQQTKNVNAVFAISVVMTESGAGTGWDYISPSTYNWYSIMGTYEGRGYTDRNGTTWKDYGSYSNATLDFGRLIAENYFTENRNLVSQIAEKYCVPPDRWAQNVRDNMTKIFENSGADFVKWNQTYSTEILAKASELFEKIHNANCYYNQGNAIPIDLNNRQVDCSSFVDWVLYELGYSDFGGWQKSTYWWYYELNPSDYGWTSFYMQDKTMADLQPGDIIVLNGTSYNRVTGITQKRNHMQIFIGAKDESHAYAYDCGDESYWNNSTDGSVCDSTLWAYSGAKVIRINK